MARVSRLPCHGAIRLAVGCTRLRKVSPGRILIVDDEPQIRRFLRVSLTAHGFEISEAANAQEALQRLASEPPALIVLDLGLPDRDGQDLLPDIRAISTAPVIVLSVRADEREKVRALDAGAMDYVV